MYSNKKRILNYSLAINEALRQSMEMDKSIVLIGQGVKSPWYVGNTTKGLLELFGDQRVIDTPISENAMTGVGVGISISGGKAIVVHPRMDFMLYAFDPIINEASNWCYMSGGNASVPVVFWGIINRGGEQGAQHSQALQTVFAHIPGLKVVAPSSPLDAKGLMISAIADSNPVVFIDDRWLYNLQDEVPENYYSIEIGKAKIIQEGSDVTLISYSYLIEECKKAIKEIGKKISVELIDLRTLKPLDASMICESVQKTGRVIIVDGTWKSYGVSAEITASINDLCFKNLKSGVKRIALPDTPAPAASTLESAYYPNKDMIITEIEKIILC